MWACSLEVWLLQQLCSRRREGVLQLWLGLRSSLRPSPVLQQHTGLRVQFQDHGDLLVHVLHFMFLLQLLMEAAEGHCLLEP